MKHTFLTSTTNSFASEVERLGTAESARKAEYSAVENKIEAKNGNYSPTKGKLSLFREELYKIEKTLSSSEKNLAVLKTLIDNKNTEISRLKLQLESSQVKKDRFLNKPSEITANEQILRAKSDGFSNELKYKRDLLQDIESRLNEKDLALESKRRDLFSFAEITIAKIN